MTEEDIGTTYRWQREILGRHTGGRGRYWDDIQVAEGDIGTTYRWEVTEGDKGTTEGDVEKT